MARIQQTVIYVVYDDVIVRRILLDFLSDLGYSALPVNSAWELIANMEANHREADVVVAKLDVVERNGIDILRAMHIRYPEVAIILIVNSHRSLSAADAIACGTCAYLHEPIRLSELEICLARLQRSATVATCPSNAQEMTTPVEDCDSTAVTATRASAICIAAFSPNFSI